MGSSDGKQTDWSPVGPIIPISGAAVTAWGGAIRSRVAHIRRGAKSYHGKWTNWSRLRSSFLLAEQPRARRAAVRRRGRLCSHLRCQAHSYDGKRTGRKVRQREPSQLGDTLVVYPHTSPSSDRLYDRTRLTGLPFGLNILPSWHLSIMASYGHGFGQRSSPWLVGQRRGRYQITLRVLRSRGWIVRANKWPARRARWLPSDALVEYSPPLHRSGRVPSDDNSPKGPLAPPRLVRLFATDQRGQPQLGAPSNRSKLRSTARAAVMTTPSTQL